MKKNKSLPTFDDLRSKIKDIPISLILRNYISLRQSGHNYIGLCPFHTDKHPSLHVSDQKGLFRCFVCDVGGDAITFVQKKENVSFLEALKILARLLDLPVQFSFENRKENIQKKEASNFLNEIAALYYKIGLISNPKDPFSKFLEKRKLEKSTIKKFQIGHAPHGNTLCKILEKEKKQLPDLIYQKHFRFCLELGLIQQNEDTKEYYDFFRNRAMIPICNSYGEVIGFSGRALEDNPVAKYLNSKESFLFQKKDVLFGYHHAKDAILKSGTVILVEGHLDMISLYQAKIESVCAIMVIYC